MLSAATTSTTQPSSELQLGSLLRSVSQLVIEEKYDTAVAQVAEMIAKHPDDAHLHLARGYLGLFCPQPDFKLIDEDFVKADTLKETKQWHLLRREYFLMLPDYRRAATEHKHVLKKLTPQEKSIYNDTFFATLNCLMASSILAPDRCFELLKLRAEFSFKPEDIKVLQSLKKIFDSYPGAKYANEKPTPAFLLFKTTALSSISNLVSQTHIQLHDLIFINLNETLSGFLKLEDEEKKLQTAYRLTDIATMVKSVYPGLPVAQLTYLTMAIRFWLKNNPTINLNKNCCEEINRLREAPTQPNDDKEFDLAEHKKLSDNFELKKSIAFLSKLIAKYPGTRKAYIDRVTSYLFLDPVKYSKQIEADLKIMHFLHYIIDYEEKDDPEWHKLRNEFSTSLPKNADTSLVALAKAAGIDSDDLNEVSMRIRLIENATLRKKYDNFAADLQALTTKVHEQGSVTPKNINVIKTLHERCLVLLKLIAEELTPLDSEDFDNEIHHKNNNGNQKPRVAAVRRSPAHEKKAEPTAEANKPVLPKPAVPVINPSIKTVVIPEDNNDPFIEVKGKQRTKPIQQNTPKPVYLPKTIAKPDSVANINFPPLTASASGNINKPVATQSSIQPHRLFFVKPALAASPVTQVNIHPVEPARSVTPEVKEPKVILSQEKTVHYDFFPTSPRKSEEKVPQVNSAQYNLLLDQINNLEQVNNYLNYVCDINEGWKINLANQLGAIGIPLILPQIMSLQEFTQWSVWAAQQNNQEPSPENQRTHGFGKGT